MMRSALAASIIALSLSACATAVPPVEVTRFHVGNPPVTGTVAVEEMVGNPDISLEFRTYAAAVGQELQRAGFTQAASANSDYKALVSFRRSSVPPALPVVAHRSASGLAAAPAPMAAVWDLASASTCRDRPRMS